MLHQGAAHWQELAEVADHELPVLQKEADCAQHSLVRKNAHKGIYNSGLV
jgi:hypothetical protein